MVEVGPIPAIHGVVRWRLVDLARWVFEEYRISVTKQILSRERYGVPEALGPASPSRAGRSGRRPLAALAEVAQCQAAAAAIIGELSRVTRSRC